MLFLVHPDGAELDIALSPQAADQVIVLAGGVDEDVMVPAAIHIEILMPVLVLRDIDVPELLALFLPALPQPL